MSFHHRHQTMTRGVAVLGLLGALQVVLSPQIVAPAKAQPVTAKPDEPKLGLADADKVAIATAAGLLKQERLCKTPIALKVTDASTEQIVAQIKVLLPKAVIEVRKPGSARFTLDLQGVTVGQILQSIAGLAGCKVYVLSDQVLIAPEVQLGDTERQQAKEWAKNIFAGGSEWSAETSGRDVMYRTLVTDLQQQLAAVAAPPGTPTTTTLQLTFGQLSPTLQQAMQHLVDMTPTVTELAIAQVTSDASVVFDNSDPEDRVLTLSLTSLDRAMRWHIHPWNIGPKQNAVIYPPVEHGPLMGPKQ